MTNAIKLQAADRDEGRHAVDVYTHGLSHGLSTLTEVMGKKIDSIDSSSLRDAVAAALVDVRRLVLAASDLADELLDMDSFWEQPLFIDETLSQSQDLIRSLAGREMGVIFNQQDSNVPVRISVAAVQHLLMNLVVNARDAEADRVEINLEREPCSCCDEQDTEDCDAGLVALEVYDNGKGMSMDLLDSINASLKHFAQDTEHGTGIAAANNIVRRAGGHMYVSNGADGGTSVVAWLPHG
ncbi:MAG: ATP-binding protein [Pseudomonadota bacterium]